MVRSGAESVQWDYRPREQGGVAGVTHFVEHVDWSFGGEPRGYAGHAEGLARKVLVGRDNGAIHTELAIARLEPGG
jgi:hypothetical protein